jgi:hypothetical protein
MTTNVSSDYNPLNIQRAAWFTPTGRGSDGKSWGRWGLVVNWIGNPGTGKSAMLENLARECGLPPTIVTLGSREPGDILGLPIPNHQTKATEYFAPKWAMDTAKRPSVLYFDEMNHASPAVQGSMQRVLLEGYAGDFKLPDDVRFVISINPIDQASGAGGSEISVALANRICHIHWRTTEVTDWCSWARSGGSNNPIKDPINAQKFQDEILDEWPKHYSKAVGLVTAYIRANPTELDKMPNLDSPEASGAWASRRSWEKAILALASSYAHNLSQSEREIFMAGFIGSSAANTFWQWVEKVDLPDIPDVLDGKGTFTHDEKRFDRTYAFTSGATTLVLQQAAGALRDSRVTRLCKILHEIAPKARDIAFPVLEDLLKSDIQRLVPANCWADPAMQQFFAESKTLLDYRRQILGG